MSKKKPTSSEMQGGEGEGSVAILPYVYRPAPNWDAAIESEEGASSDDAAPGAPQAPTESVVGGSQQEKVLMQIKESWEQGFLEGTNQARAESEAAITQQRDAFSAALKDFAHQREEYFHHVESEVVALALAI